MILNFSFSPFYENNEIKEYIKTFKINVKYVNKCFGVEFNIYLFLQYIFEIIKFYNFHLINI